MKLAFLFSNVVFWTFVMQLFLPWWIVGVVSFILAYILEKSKFIAFSACLLAVFALWIVKAYWADSHFDVPVSNLVSSLLGNISGSSVFFLTGIIGGLIGGLGGLLGTWTRTLSQKN